MPGVRIRVLHADLQQMRMTALMKVEPGARYPSHTHNQVEECYVLEGDLDFGDYQLFAGDYLRLPAGTTHSESTSISGCVCLITAALPKSLMESLQ